MPNSGPPAHCKATTGAATPLAQTLIWPRAHIGQDTWLSTQGSVPVWHGPVPFSCCLTMTWSSAVPVQTNTLPLVVLCHYASVLSHRAQPSSVALGAAPAQHSDATRGASVPHTGGKTIKWQHWSFHGPSELCEVLVQGSCARVAGGVLPQSVSCCLPWHWYESPCGTPSYRQSACCGQALLWASSALWPWAGYFVPLQRCQGQSLAVLLPEDTTTRLCILSPCHGHWILPTYKPHPTGCSGRLQPGSGSQISYVPNAPSIHIPKSSKLRSPGSLK